MKKAFILSALLIAATCGINAQNDYIVLTKGAKKVANANPNAAPGEEGQQEEEEPEDFIGKNFHYYSMCSWAEGMKFMVMPERRDLIVNTFVDAETGKEVGSGSLRHKVLIYKELKQDDGYSRLYFDCPENQKKYYFQVPFGSYEEYCNGKLGIPTLAFLGDVDKAREVLLGQTVTTQTNKYYADSHSNAGGVEAVDVEKNSLVKIVAIGAGTRSFPVKIICEDKTGRQFFMNVAISNTNSGMDDADFEKDDKVHSFYGAFGLLDPDAARKGKYGKYMDEILFLRHQTTMQDANGNATNMKRFSQFKVMNIMQTGDDKVVRFTLQAVGSKEVYEKEVSMSQVYNPGDNIENRFVDLFGVGNARPKGTTDEMWAHVQKGEVARGMSEDEVRLSIGKPDKAAKSKTGNHDWVYTLRHLIVKFNAKGKVIGIIKG